MKRYFIPALFTTLFCLITSCGSGKAKAGHKSDSTVVYTDSIPVLSEYNIQALKDSNSARLTSWIVKHIPKDRHVLKLNEATDLLKAIHYPLKPSQKLMAETIRDTSDTNQYITYLWDDQSFLLIFLMDTVTRRIVQAADWTEDVADHFYRVNRFGKNYMALLGHTSSGTENEYGFIFNKHLKKMLYITQTYDCWSDEPYSSQQMFSKHTLINDSTLQVDVEFKNRELEKVKKQYKMQLIYSIQSDTIMCTDPGKLKVYEKKRKEFNINN